MRNLLRRLLRRTGLFEPIRSLYHRLFYTGRTTPARCGAVVIPFSTPTPTLAEHVRTLTGEGPVLEAFLASLHEQDIVWDVGAGFGLYTLFASARLASGGAVHAFEPEPGMRTLLESNVARAGGGAVHIHPLALGATDGGGGLFASDSPNPGTSSFVRRSDYPVQRTAAEVGVLRGDTCILRGIAPSPTAIKIDVEGAEALVLAGLASTLASGAVRLLCCEVHPELLPLFGTSAEAVEETIRSAGFKPLLRRPRGTELHILSRRSP